jgi:protein-L-isoaspartate O-methyltransferase
VPDWAAWHDGYDSETWLRARLHVVQRLLRQAAAERDELRVVSLCAGQARDLAGALAGSAARIRGCAVEIDPRNAEAARAALDAAGLSEIDVVCGDAALTDHYLDAAPADLVVVCGVFGNLTDDDVNATIDALPSLCAEGGHVVWTRHRNSPDMTPAIRRRLAEAGFAEVAFEAPEGAVFAVGLARSTRPPEPLLAGDSSSSWATTC